MARRASKMVTCVVQAVVFIIFALTAARAQDAPLVVTLQNARTGAVLGSTTDQAFTASTMGDPASRWVIQQLGSGQMRVYAEQTGAFLHLQNGYPELGRIEADWRSAVWMLQPVDRQQRLMQLVSLVDPNYGLTIGEDGVLAVAPVAGPAPGSVWRVAIADAGAQAPPAGVAELPPDTRFSTVTGGEVTFEIHNVTDWPLEVVRIGEDGSQQSFGALDPQGVFSRTVTGGDVWHVRYLGQTLRQIIVYDTTVGGPRQGKLETYPVYLRMPPLAQIGQYAQVKVLNTNALHMQIRAAGMANMSDIAGRAVDYVGALSWVTVFAQPGQELWFTDSVGNPVGGTYRVSDEAYQRVEAPIPDTAQTHVYLTNTLDQPVDAVEVSNDGESQVFLGKIPPRGIIRRPVVDGQPIFFSADGRSWLGGEYVPTGQEYQFARVPLPERPTPPPAEPPSPYPAGSVPVFVANTTDAPVQIVEYVSETDQVLRGEVAELTGGSVMADPGMKLAFVQTIDGSLRFVGDLYDVTDNPQQICKFPIPLPEPEKLVQVTVTNNTDLKVGVLDHKSDTEQTQLSEIDPRTARFLNVPVGTVLSFVQTIDGSLKFVGGRYSVTDKSHQGVGFPLKDNAQAVAAAVGSIRLKIINITDSPVLPVEMITEKDQRQLGEVAGVTNATIGVEPGMLLRFAQNTGGGLSFVGGAFRVQDAPEQQVVFPVAQPDLPAAPTSCWRDSYGRGAGWAGQDCPPGEENYLGLCYPKCRPGYKGVFDSCVYASCPAGWTEGPFKCWKPKPYERGAEPLRVLEGLRVAPAMARCEARFGKGNCEGANFIASGKPTIVYEKCPAGYEQAPVATNLCRPSCKEQYTGIAGMGDLPLSCTKPTYKRRGAEFPSCPTETVVDGKRVPVEKDETGLLCYQQCKPGMKGVGPVCWDGCPSQLPVNCGAFCAKDKDTCALGLTEMISEPTMAIANAALIGVTAGAAAGATTALNAGRAAATTATKSIGSAAVKSTAKVAARATLRAKVKAALGETAKDQVIDAAVNAAMVGGSAAGGAGFDPVDLDPLGIAQTVRAFNLPICSDIKWSKYQQ